MASSIVHATIAIKLKDKLKINNYYDYLLGSIAPDIGKIIGVPKNITHFFIRENVPDLTRFIKEYPNYLTNDFLLGYFIHLYCDDLWFNKFLLQFVSNNQIHLLNGQIIEHNERNMIKVIYHDYDLLNADIIKKYHLDYSFLTKSFVKPNIIFKEFDVSKIYLINEQTYHYLTSSHTGEYQLFNMDMIDNYINNCIKEIINYLKEINYDFQ